MVPPPLRVRCPDPAADAADVVELVSMTFGNYFAVRRESLDHYVLHSHYDWSASAIGRVGGALVSHWGVWDYRMRVGSAIVRCGGVGGVATHADHRGEGHMAHTAPHSIARMRERGYGLSVLFGIDRFYHRFGYVPAWRESRWHVLRKDLPTPPARPPRLRRIEPVPRADVARLHNRWNAGLTGTAVRPTYSRGVFRTHTPPETYLWRDAQGRVSGHLAIHEEGAALVCTEALGQPAEVLAGLGLLAARRGLPELRIDTLPYRSAVAGALRRLDCRYEQRFAWDGEAMIRVVDLAGCLRAMEAELSTRLSASPLARWRGILRIEGPEEEVSLRVGGGRVRVGPPAASPHRLRAGWAVAQLLIGTDDPEETCAQRAIELAGDAARLVPVLFPAQHPELHLADRF